MLYNTEHNNIEQRLDTVTLRRSRVNPHDPR